MRIPTALVCLVTLQAACASTPDRHDRARITATELLAGRPLGLTEDPPTLVDEAEVLAVNDEMRAFLDRHVARGTDRTGRLRRLGSAIIRGGGFHLRYDETTRTAAATFQEKRGNCLSFSNMFVAMAREVGLNASFQEVDTPPDWSFKDDTFILNRHVNVLVDVGAGVRREERLGSLIGRPVVEGEHVVDFNIEDFRTTYDRRRISDARARAHFYNNLAVERMQAGDVAAALGYFRKAIGNDSTFAPAWTNLGILYMRGGHSAHAEAAYRHALDAHGSDFVALSNLASLYAARGDRERAASYRKSVARHRNRNPYYRFRLARAAFDAGEYDTAIHHLSDAIRRRKNEDQFYFLMGLSHLKKGDPRAARYWLARAEAVAATDAQKRRYADKMESLFPAAPDDGQRR